MENENYNLEDEPIGEIEGQTKCDPILKPTLPPPGGSSLGYWACDETQKKWVWVDSVA